MKSKKKTILNVAVILLILSFFFTPIGHYGKVFLNRLVAFSPEEITIENRVAVDYDWKLKNDKWEFFNFEKSKGNVVFVNFWASWRIPSEAELKGVQNLYDSYKGKVDFYIITNELREPVKLFMEERKYNFPVTYLIIGEKMPFNAEVIPSSYILDKKGRVAMKNDDIADWDSSNVYELLEELLVE